MSITLTETKSAIQTTSPIETRLVLKRPLVVLVNKMRSSDLFSEALKSKIVEISDEYERCHDDPQGALCAIALYVTQVIHPAISEHKGVLAKQDALLEFEDDVRKILALRLPEECDVDLFLEDCENWDVEESKTKAKLEKIKSSFQALHKAIDEALLKSHKAMKKMAEAAQKKLLEIDDNRTSKSTEIYGQLDSLKDRVNAAMLKIKAGIEKTDELESQLISHQESLRKLLADNDDLFKGI